MIKKKLNNLLAYDFVGKQIYVTGSNCKSLIGKKGIIINETKNTFIVETNNHLLKLLKTQIRFKINETDIEINGKNIVKTSDERLKSNI